MSSFPIITQYHKQSTPYVIFDQNFHNLLTTNQLKLLKVLVFDNFKLKCNFVVDSNFYLYFQST